jgi:GT2 family glycosyltransferase
MKSQRTPSVKIIILNWNRKAEIMDCLASLQSVHYPNFEILVVDNGSSDGSQSIIRTTYPQVTLAEMGHNLGFVEGNNAGIKSALTTHSDYVLLLNNDTLVSPDFLNDLVDAAEADQTVGAVGPTIYYTSQPQKIWSAGGSIDWQRGLTHMLAFDEIDHGQLGLTAREVDFISGCAILVKKSVIDQVGMLDPRFFSYYEETEWCVRIKRAGYRLLHVPTAHIQHRLSPEAREASPIVHYYMTRNRLLFLKLVRAGIRPWFYTLFLDYALTLMSWSLKPSWQHKQPQRNAMIRAIYDYGRGHFAEY